MAVLLHHDHGSLQQIANVVAQVAVDAHAQELVAEVSVAAEANFRREEVADVLSAVETYEFHGIYDVAHRLGHLLAVARPPAVCKNSLKENLGQIV